MKMSSRGLGLLFAGIGAAVPAAVGMANQQIELSTVAEKFCNFDQDPTLSGAGNISVIALDRPVTQLAVTNPAGVGGLAQGWGFTFKIHATCNSPSQITLATLNGGLKNAAPASGGYTNFIDYYAITAWPPGFANVNLFTTGTPTTAGPSLSAAAQTGELEVSVGWNGAGPHSGAPLLGGYYTDTLTVNLIPQL